MRVNSKPLEIEIVAGDAELIIVRRLPARNLDRENKPVTKRGWNRSPRLQQSLQVLLGRLLKSQNGFPPVTPLSMTTRQKPRLGNPYAIFIPAHLNLGDRNNHAAQAISDVAPMVNAATAPSWMVAQASVPVGKLATSIRISRW